VGTSFVLSRGQYTHFIATLPNLEIVFSTPLGVNDFGLLAGIAADPAGQEYAFVAIPQLSHRSD